MTALTPAERLQAAAAKALGSLPVRAKRRIAGAPVRLDGLELDLDTQVLLRLAEHKPRPILSEGTPADARAYLTEASRLVAGPPAPGVDVRQCTVSGAAGPLAARLFRPAELPAGEPGALVVYFHGGGFVAGDLNTHDQVCRLLARSSGASVLSVDYRLAPEHRFPAAIDDALAAFRDAVARAHEFGADPVRIAVAGDSAGGHLAAVTSQLSAADGGPSPAFQLLIYPVTDVTRVSQSRTTFAEGFFLTQDDMDWYEKQFLAPDDDHSDPRASPLLAEDLTGLAPAMVVTAGFDPLRDEGEAYGQRLIDAGVRTIMRRYPGYVHGFINTINFGPGAREAIAEMGGVVRAALSA
jgi:acetyl esterase